MLVIQEFMIILCYFPCHPRYTYSLWSFDLELWRLLHLSLWCTSHGQIGDCSGAC